MRVEILLSTYNGEKFLREQMDSLLAQSYKDWVCSIRDDGSTDNTIGIIQEYVSIYPNHFQLLQDRQHVGWRESFRRLLDNCKGDIIFFCDQDDIWLSNKVKIISDIMFEISYKNKPALLISDLQLVNANKETIANSYWDFINEKHCDIWPDEVFYNPYPGMSMCINRQLLNLILPVPEGVAHDWWIALNASLCNTVYKLPMILGVYRQHKNNAEGAKSSIAQLAYEYMFSHPEKPRKYIKSAYKMMLAILRKKNVCYSRRKIREVEKLCKILSQNVIMKKFLMCLDNHIWPRSFIRKIGLIWFC